MAWGETRGDRRLIVTAHAMLGFWKHIRGHFPSAHDHHTAPLVLNDQGGQPLIVRPVTPEVMAGAYLSITLACLGRTEQASRQAALAVAKARRLVPSSLAFTLNLSSRARLILRDDDQLRREAEEEEAISERLGLPFWLALSRCSLGWLAAKQGDPAKGLDLVVQGLDSLDTLGVVLHREWAGGGLMDRAPRRGVEAACLGRVELPVRRPGLAD